MALDKGTVHNLNLRADGSQLLDVMRSYGKEIRAALREVVKFNAELQNGHSKIGIAQQREMQNLKRMLSDAKAIQDMLAGTTGNRRKNKLFDGLDEQALGRKTLSASKLKRELEQTKTASDALEVRLAQLYKRFNSRAEAGRKVGQRDISKAMNTEEAIRQVRRLEQALAKLDARQKLTGKPMSSSGQQLRSDLGAAQTKLLDRVKSGTRVNYTAEIAQLEILIERYRRLSKAETEATIASDRLAASRSRLLTSQMNQSEPMLRADVRRKASGFDFNQTQARGFDITKVNSQIDTGVQRLMMYQRAMANAVASGRSTEAIDRLSRSFENLKLKVAQATAQKKAFDALPESRMRALNETLFGGGGMAFATRIAGASLITTGVFAAINAMTNGARAVAEFEDGIAKLQAISGATDTEMRTMASGILEVGKNSRYATNEIVESAAAIAQAGYSAQETVGVLSASMNLAAASGSTPAEAIDTMTGALGAFQIEASGATQVADTLVGGLNRSKLSIQQMQAAIQYAGATANETGMSLEELTAIAASLSNAGIRTGSTIGTGTRQLMVDLKTPTENFKKELADLGLNMADVDVRAKGLMGVVKTLRDNGFSAAAAYESFETRAASAFLALMGQVDGYDQLSQSIMQTGVAAAAADKASDSLLARFTQLLNTLTSLTVKMSGPFMAALSGVVKVATVTANVLDALATGVGGLIGITGDFGRVFSNVFVVGLAGFFVGGPIGAVIGGLAALVGSVGNSTDKMDELQAATNNASAKLDEQNTRVNAVDAAISGLISRQTELATNQGALQTETQSLVTRFQGLALQLDSTAGSYDGLMNAMLRYRAEQLQQTKLTAQETQITASQEATNLQERLTGNTDRFRGRHTNSYFQANKDMFLRPTYGLSGQNAVQGEIVKLKQKGDLNQVEQGLLEALQDRLLILQQLAAAQLKVKNAEQTIGMADARMSEAGQNRTRGALAVESGITAGLEMNQRSAGSGIGTITSIRAAAQDMLVRLRGRLVALDQQSAEAKDINSTIRAVEAQLSRVVRTDRKDAEALEKDKPKDRAGSRLTSDQVAARLKRLIPSASISDTTRSVGQQAGFDRAAGIKRDAGGAPHVQGRAIDMPPIAGMDPMEVVQMIEDMGLEVTEAPVRRSGIRYVDPNHGTGRHWHFAWKSKATRFQRGAESDAEKEARDLQTLLQQRAGFETGATEKSISAYISSSKAGTINVPKGRENLDLLTSAYRSARLAEFDTQRPEEGMSAEALTARREARKALEGEIAAKIMAWGAEFDRTIIDDAGKTLDNVMAAADRAFQDQVYAGEIGVRQAEVSGAALETDINKRRFGAGAAYLQEKRVKEAREAADVARSGALGTRAEREKAAMDGFASATKGLDPNSEAGKAAIEKLDQATTKYNETLRQRAELEGLIAARAGQGAAQMDTLTQRIRGSAQAWVDASGASDSWGKRLENSIGPVLDNLTSGFGEFFDAIFTGSKSFGAALGDMVRSFTKFVMQILIQALALEAVKGILSLFGLTLPGSFNGGIVKKTTLPARAGSNAFEGGPVIGRYAGGPISRMYGGGKVNRGVRTHDSALYNLAQGEYVVRNKSVRELGVPFMESINKHGKAGLSKMAGAGSAFTNIQAPKQETNVYVVADKKDAGMKPSDVLIVLQDDILQNGATKRLIRQVAQGG